MGKTTSFLLCFVAFFSLALKLYAGDVAIFSDLGFSEDGTIYTFAQYGVREKTLTPWAELFIVDVALNNFVPEGKSVYQDKNRIKAGQDGSSALHQIELNNANLGAKLGITFQRMGIPLFVAVENGQSPNGQTIEFRDFDNEISYEASLYPRIFADGKNIKSSYYIDLTRNEDGTSTSYQVGSPDIKRPDISSYTIRKVLAAPDGKSMIFVIEMTRLNNAGEAPDIRYMVETICFLQ